MFSSRECYSMFRGFILKRPRFIIRKRIGRYREEPFLADKMDIVEASLWDSVEINKGKVFNNNLRLFSVPRGVLSPYTGKIKTHVDTSMDMCEALPQPQHFQIKRIKFYFSKLTKVEDIFRIAEGMIFYLWMEQKWFVNSALISLHTIAELPLAPIRICEYCKAVYVDSYMCPGCGAREFRIQRGEQEVSTGFVLELPKGAELHILQGLNFKVTFEGESVEVSERLKMWCYLEGRLARGVQ